MNQRPQGDQNQDATIYLVCALRFVGETTANHSPLVCYGNLDTRGQALLDLIAPLSLRIDSDYE